jgi:hypothetical protein
MYQHLVENLPFRLTCLKVLDYAVFICFKILALPPASVPPADYYKHLMPDLPGPAKLRQLLLWNCQHWLAQNKQSSTTGNKNTNVTNQESIEAIELLAQKLLNHQFNTSWYQRPVLYLNFILRLKILKRNKQEILRILNLRTPSIF